MAEAKVTTIPKKFYRYFLKGLSYYTFHLNRACTIGELQAYVFLKCKERLNEAQLTFLSEQVMGDLVENGVAHHNGGCYRLNEFLRPEVHESPERYKQTVQPNTTGSSSPTVRRKAVTFSDVVTMWATEATINVESVKSEHPDEDQSEEGY